MSYYLYYKIYNKITNFSKIPQPRMTNHVLYSSKIRSQPGTHNTLKPVFAVGYVQQKLQIPISI